jgi:hypothetical protein
VHQLLLQVQQKVAFVRPIAVPRTSSFSQGNRGRLVDDLAIPLHQLLLQVQQKVALAGGRAVIGISSRKGVVDSAAA